MPSRSARAAAAVVPSSIASPSTATIAPQTRPRWRSPVACWKTVIAPATKNAAICLRKVGRFDEALDLFEALLRDFPDLAQSDRELAEREVRELEASVGTLQLVDAPAGASVGVDGVDRGRTPLAAPLRVAAGAHVVKVVAGDEFPGAISANGRARGVLDWSPVGLPARKCAGCQLHGIGRRATRRRPVATRLGQARAAP